MGAQLPGLGKPKAGSIHGDFESHSEAEIFFIFSVSLRTL